MEPQRLPLWRGALLVALLVAPTSACVLVDRPLLGLRSIAGGIHNQRQVGGIRPFFLPDGRLGAAANGALVLEREPGGPLETLEPIQAEIDDPDAAPDGSALVFTSGRDQETAGGGHNDHVFQLYTRELASGAWRRLGSSRRAEALPRFTRGGAHVVFARRAEYDGWSLEAPWGPASIFVAEADGSRERRLTGPLFHPLAGLELAADDSLVVFGAAPAGAGTAPCVYALAFPAGGVPRVVLADAYLPTPLPGTRELLVARVHADGHALARVDLAGRLLREYSWRVNELAGLAVSPDAARIVFSDFDPQRGRFGEYRLWTLARGAEQPELLTTLPYRLAEHFKPLDAVQPVSWWFRSAASPGSR